jgi:hypothetical protein
MHTSKRSSLPSTSPVRHNQTQSSHIHIYECSEFGTPAAFLPNFESKIHTWCACTGVHVQGVHVQGVHFTAAPRTAALSHTKLTSAETALNICVVQNGGRRNALYRKRYGMLTLDITVRLFSREQNSKSVKFSRFEGMWLCAQNCTEL